MSIHVSVLLNICKGPVIQVQILWTINLLDIILKFPLSPALIFFTKKRASHINANTNFALPLYSNVKAYISITLANLTYFSKMYIVHNFRSLTVSGTNVALTS
jgi:hypothetical protein